jgi:hypothetical protein
MFFDNVTLVNRCMKMSPLCKVIPSNLIVYWHPRRLFLVLFSQGFFLRGGKKHENRRFFLRKRANNHARSGGQADERRLMAGRAATENGKNIQRAAPEGAAVNKQQQKEYQ